MKNKSIKTIALLAVLSGMTVFASIAGNVNAQANTGENCENALGGVISCNTAFSDGLNADSLITWIVRVVLAGIVLGTTLLMGIRLLSGYYKKGDDNKDVGKIYKDFFIGGSVIALALMAFPFSNAISKSLTGKNTPAADLGKSCQGQRGGQGPVEFGLRDSAGKCLSLNDNAVLTERND